MLTLNMLGRVNTVLNYKVEKTKTNINIQIKIAQGRVCNVIHM